MFVSVHADAAPRRTAYGASVYALSEGGATSTTARFLADSENNVDLIGANEILKGRDPMLAGVLLDMSMNATISSSLDLGHKVLGQLSSITNLHQKRVEQAGFAVLKSPDIPSILVETGFISNDRDCRACSTVATRSSWPIRSLPACMAISRSAPRWAPTWRASRTPKE